MSRYRRRPIRVTYVPLPQLDTWAPRMGARPTRHEQPTPTRAEQMELIEGFRGFGPPPVRRKRQRAQRRRR
jgi:hypothetical protein